jgi:O-antigen ligase
MRKIAFWLSLVLIFILPWEDSVSINTTGSPDQAASLAKYIGFGVAGFWFWTILLEGRFRKFHLFHAFVLFFFLLNITSYLWSPDTYSTSFKVKTYAQILLLVLIFWELYQKPSEVKAGLQAYVFGGYVLIGSTILNYVNGIAAVNYEARFSATGVNAVELAVLLLLGLPFAWHLFSTADKQKGLLLRIINLAYLPLSIFAAFLTGSRTGLFAVVPALIFISWPKKANMGRLLQNFLILLVLLVVVWSFIPSSVTARLDTASASIGSADLGKRVPLWFEALKVFIEHPILGNGSGTLPGKIGSEAHNTPFSILGETGLAGFFLFVSVLLIVFNKIIKMPGEYKGLWLATLCIWVIGSSLLTWEYKKVTWILLSLAVINSSCIHEQIRLQKDKLEFSRAKTRQSLDGAGKPAA